MLSLFMKNKKPIVGLIKIIGILLVITGLTIYFLGQGRILIDSKTTSQVLWMALQGKVNNDLTTDVIYYLRLPRFLLSLFVGAGLAVCGCVMQAVLRNSLADPYLIGISSGASLGAVIAIVFGLGTWHGFALIGLFAFGGALLFSALIIVTANVLGRVKEVGLLLCGMMLNAIGSSLVSLLLVLFADTDGIQNLTYWLMGSLQQATFPQIQWVGLLVLGGTFFFWSQYRALNLLVLGEEAATTLGYSTQRIRQYYILLVAILVGTMVYVSGMIGFVGLLVPHMVRLVVGENHRILVPVSAIVGAAFLAIADMGSRMALASEELPIGIVVALIGSPIFIALLVRKIQGR